MDHNPHYPLLETFYDEVHRGKIHEERTEVLKPLHPRTHSPLAWDERYVVYICQAGMLPLACLVQQGLLMMDNAALTALVDRWRPETHTFHLPAGEMTVTLEDVAMIIGLPIDGRAVTGSINPVGWRDRVEALVGFRPPQPPEGAKDRRTTGVSSGWIAEHFGQPPAADADDAVVERYARAWLWHMLAGFLFPDSSGNTISWMWLDVIGHDWESLRTYSWGLAALSWLYRQLCEACRRTGENSNLGGCALLLQVWMWERIPVARPDRRAPGLWPYEDEGSLPTVAFLWKNILNVYGNSMRRYIDYSNELDCLLDSHVTWEPYRRNEVQGMALSPLCTRDRQFWRSVLPLICFFLMEYHLPCRVARQFGFLQHASIDHTSTSQLLHKTDRRSQRGAKNWEEKHLTHIHNWNNRQNSLVQGGALHRDRPYREEYLEWLKQNSRLKLRVAMNVAHIEDLPSEDEGIVDDYDLATREGTRPERGPIQDYIGHQLTRFSNEAGHALGVPFGSPEAETTLRGFIDRIRRGCRRMARKMNCIAAPDDAFVAAAGGSAARSGSHRQTSVTRTSSRTTTSCGGRRGISLSIGSPSGSTSAARGISASSSRGKAAVVDNSDNSDNSEEEDPTYVQDIIGSSQLFDAPSPTEGTPTKRRARRRDHTDVGSANVLPTEPGRPRRKKKPFTPHRTEGRK
ncbi:unnamed protein product [Urochloa humidicola]